MEGIVRGSGPSESCSWALLRLGHVWGPKGGAPYRGFFLAIARGYYVHLGQPDAPKRLAYVGNVVHQIESFLRAPAERIDGRLLYVADHQPICIGDWAEVIAAAMGRRPPHRVPEPIVRLAARSGDVLALLGWRNPPLSSQRLIHMRTPSPSIPIEETLDLAGSLPFTLAEGVEATIRWLEQQGLIKKKY